MRASYYDVVVTPTPHWKEKLWHVCTCGIAVAREERDKLTKFSVETIDTHGIIVVPLATELQGTTGARSCRGAPKIGEASSPQPPNEDDHSKSRPGADAAHGVTLHRNSVRRRRL